MVPLSCSLLLALIAYAQCANILGILHMPGRSHYLAGSTLMKILAENGHKVTVVSPFGEKNPPKNYRDVILTDIMQKQEERKMNFFELKLNPFLSPIIFTFLAGGMVEDLFNHTNFQNLMNSGENFDLVIMEQFNSDAIKYVAHHFKAPLIVYTALETNDWINPYQGNPDNPAYTPTLLVAYRNEMTFFERVFNTIVYTTNQLFRVFFYIHHQNRILHKYFPDAPHLNEIIDNVSLVFANTDPSIHEPLPRVPSIISVGGFHIVQPKALPKDIQNILDNAKNGVIYFSLGSNLKSKDMPIAKREVLMKVFSKLKQTVIWKFEDEALPGKPDNVIIKKWLPQNDMFAHKNIKLFISHGGVFSTMEALYHSIPVLAFPIFGDQIINAKRATAGGYARWLDFTTLNEHELESAIEDLLTNPKYAENAKARSWIMHDRPMTPQETIKYWVDYIIRHKGADHLRVASLKLSWYQYVLLDVICFIILTFVLLMAVITYILKMLFRMIKKKKQNKLKKN